MSIDTPPSPASQGLVERTSAELSRLVTRLVEQLEERHARDLDEAIVAVRREADEALRQLRADADAVRQGIVDEAEQQARDASAERERLLAESFEQRAREIETRLRAEFEDATRRRAAEDAEVNALRAERVREEVEEARRVAREEARQAARDVEEQLREHAQAAIAARDAALQQLGAASGTAPAPAAADGAGEREGRLAALDRLLRGVARIDEAATLRGALDALADAVACEAPRSVILLVRNEQVRGWRASGVAGGPDIAAVGCSLDQAGPLGRAVVSGETVSVDAQAAGSVPGLSFLGGDEDTVGLAVPVVVDGQAVALVYADDGATSDREVPASWPEAIQVLARHTARCLESLTARRAARLRQAEGGAAEPARPAPGDPPPMAADAESARRFARLLVSEVKLYNEAAVQEGRRARDLRRRLHEAIRRAREQYDERVPGWLPGRDEYFEQELVRTLADGDPDRLGAPGSTAT